MSSFYNLKTEVLSDRIADEILTYIQTTPVKIGSRIPTEEKLCEMFKVSRSTVREAVKDLSSKGILRVKRGDGTYVIATRVKEYDPLNLQSVKDKLKLALDLVEVRLMLEPDIAALAAKNADEKDKADILRLCRIVEDRIEKEESYVEFDIAFHAAIAKASRNTVIKELIPIIDTAVMMFVNVTHKKLRSETVITHRMVAEAISKNDVEGARGAMNMHLTFNRNAIKELFDQRNL